MGTRFWIKFEWDPWRNDPDLRRCSKETRGFWIDCIAAMEDEAERRQTSVCWIEGTPDQICRIVGATRDEFDRSVAELKRENAATVLESQGVVKIISRRLLRIANEREYNKLKKRESRGRHTVNVPSTDSSKDKSLENRDKSKEEEKEREREDHSPEAPPGLAPSPFEHPAVILFDELMCVTSRTNFAKEVAARVIDLDVWNTLLRDKIAFADKSLEERRKVANWILIEYDKRVKEKQNGSTERFSTNIVNFRDQRAAEAVQTRNVVDAAAARVAERDARRVSGPNDDSGPRQLRGVVENSDAGGDSIASGDVGADPIQSRA